jgi:hypothetical protein
VGDKDWKIGLGMHNFREAERQCLAGDYVRVSFEELPFSRPLRPGFTSAPKVLPQLAKTRARMRRERKIKYESSRYGREAFFQSGGVEFDVGEEVGALVNLHLAAKVAESTMPDDDQFLDISFNHHRVDLWRSRKVKKWTRILRKLRRQVKAASREEARPLELDSVLRTLEKIWDEPQELAPLEAGQTSLSTDPLTKDLHSIQKKQKHVAAIGKIMSWDTEESWNFSQLVKQHGEAVVFKPGNPYGYGFAEFKKWSRYSKGIRVEVVTDSPEELISEDKIWKTLGKVIAVTSGSYLYSKVFEDLTGPFREREVDAVRPNEQGLVYTKPVASDDVSM